MKRREFITLVGGAATLWPFAARAQQSDKTVRVGFFGNSLNSPPPDLRRGQLRVVQRFRHGCSAARNSPACKGKRLRCLRKCRSSYIDTSPALSARSDGRFMGMIALFSAPSTPPSVQRAQFKTFCRVLGLQSLESFGRMARPRAALGTEYEGCALQSCRLCCGRS